MCLSNQTAMLPYSAMTTSLHTYAHTYFTFLSTCLWKVNPTHLLNWPKKQWRQIPHKSNEQLLLVSCLRSHITPYINNHCYWNQHSCRNCKNTRPHATVRRNLWTVMPPSALFWDEFCTCNITWLSRFLLCFINIARAAAAALIGNMVFWTIPLLQKQEHKSLNSIHVVTNNWVRYVSSIKKLLTLEMVVFELWSSGAEAKLPSFAAEANCRSTCNLILLGALPCDCSTIPFMFGCSFRPWRGLILIPVSPLTNVSKSLGWPIFLIGSSTWPIEPSFEKTIWGMFWNNPTLLLFCSTSSLG